MTVSPVSADLLIKLGIGAALVLGGVYLLRQIGSMAGNALGGIADSLPPLDSVVDAVNPASDQNLAYRGVNAVGGAVSGDKNWSLGSWLYDATHPTYDPNK